MAYVGSYVWKIRQKIGHDLLIIPSVDVVAIDDGKVLVTYNKDSKTWVFPGGYAEEGLTSSECASVELLEEAGLEASPDTLVPFAFMSGYTHSYTGGDITQPFCQVFLAKEWRDVGGVQDHSEVAGRKWVLLDSIIKEDMSLRAWKTVNALKEFQKTGQYQMIDLKGVRLT